MISYLGVARGGCYGLSDIIWFLVLLWSMYLMDKLIYLIVLLCCWVLLMLQYFTSTNYYYKRIKCSANGTSKILTGRYCILLFYTTQFVVYICCWISQALSWLWSVCIPQYILRWLMWYYRLRQLFPCTPHLCLCRAGLFSSHYNSFINTVTRQWIDSIIVM